MNFSTKEWRKMYDRVKCLGQMLKDSYPWVDEDRVVQPPIAPLDEETQEAIAKEIKRFTRKSVEYLNSCGMRSPKPLWIYNPADVTTWVSHESFRFGHLLPKNRPI